MTNILCTLTILVQTNWTEIKKTDTTVLEYGQIQTNYLVVPDTRSLPTFKSEPFYGPFVIRERPRDDVITIKASPYLTNYIWNWTNFAK